MQRMRRAMINGAIKCTRNTDGMIPSGASMTKRTTTLANYDGGQYHYGCQREVQNLPSQCYHSVFKSSSLISKPSVPRPYHPPKQQHRQSSSSPNIRNKGKTVSSTINTDDSSSRNKSIKSSNNNNNKKSRSTDEKIPLLNEHLIAELFNKMKGRLNSGEEKKMLSADTYQVRLIVDRGRRINNNGIEKSDSTNITDSKMQEEVKDIDIHKMDAHVTETCTHDNAKEEEEEEEEEECDTLSSALNANSSSQSAQVTTLNQAISIAHEYELDLMEVALQAYPPVIKAVNYDKYAYEQRRKQSKMASSKKKKGGGGAISDRSVKEYKFRAGIADHDLNRKTRDMLEYIDAGHAVRVTLTARQRSLNEDGNAITTTLERVKELLGDKAVEVRGIKANDRNSYGSLLFHPNTKK